MTAHHRSHAAVARPRAPLAPAFLAAFLSFALALPTAEAAASAGFSRFLESLWPHAAKRGVSRGTFERAFAGVTPDPEVLALAGKQPEFKTKIWDYMAGRVNDVRIEKGREKAAEWDRVLAAIETSFGVDRYVVLAVWGMETNYGKFLGGHSVIRALATLATSKRRPDYFRGELLNALDILERGDTDPKHMIGSWAGAMGHTQFMPSSFKAYAVDITGDGRRDIWTSIPDALASTANYLKKHGWRAGETWGYEVVLPPGIDLAKAKKRGKLTLGQWQRLGVTRAGGKAFPRQSDEAYLLTPAGADGPAFLMLPNFRVIKRYNNSDAYALAVGHLADRIRGGGPFVTPWPDGDGPMSKDDRLALQGELAKLGYDIGDLDGAIGSKTREAIRAYQNSIGMPVDGYASIELLTRMRRGR